MDNNSLITIIGFGSQAKAWAMNLRDSGRSLQIALRNNSPSLKIAQKMGLTTVDLAEEQTDSQIFILLTPDHTHIDILNQLKETISAGAMFIYAHGFSYHKENFKTAFAQWNHCLLAPKAIASEVRFQYETQGKLGAVYSVEDLSSPADKELSRTYLLALAKDLGITGGPYEGSFAEETIADLFSEQSILCSILPYTAYMSFTKLIEKGVKEEIAYMECWLEVKLIADAMVKMGPHKFFELISPNALIGGEKGRKILLDAGYEKKLDQLLEDICDKKFYAEVDHTDFAKIKDQTLTFWKGTQLSNVHERIAKDLL